MRIGEKALSELRSEESLHPDMVWIPGGTIRMGSDTHYPEEAPAHRVTADGSWIGCTPVTNRQSEEFVRATGHVSFAEIPPDPKDCPGVLPQMLFAGSLMFTPPGRFVDLKNWGEWWDFLIGAEWRHPYGPKRNTKGLSNHPVESYLTLAECAYLPPPNLRDFAN
jgi:formylglycine-generating enzyme